MPSSVYPRSSNANDFLRVTCGTLAVITETMMTRRCITWLCSTFARSARGVVSLFGWGKIATPSTRGIFIVLTRVDELVEGALELAPGILHESGDRDARSS